MRFAGGTLAMVGALLDMDRALHKSGHVGVDQKGGSSDCGVLHGSEVCWGRAPALSPPEPPVAHGSSPELRPPPPCPPLALRDTLAVAYFSAGPISSTSISKTVRRSPSRVS